MSKHLGNILEPIPLMDRHGADAVRWFMLAGGSPWSARRVGHETLSEVVRKVLLTYWNTASFFTLYAEANGWDPAADARRPARAERPLLDRWALAELAQVTADVTAALEDFDTQGAGRLLAGFVDDLSNWYVRRSRRRFWDGDPAALATLHEVLDGLTRLMAPFTPFVTEEVWARAVAPGLAGGTARRDSVHLASWPAVDEAARDDELVAQVALVRRLVELGRSARTSSKVRTRQPLARAVVAAPGWARLPRDLVAEVADELNVAELVELSAVGELVDVSVKIDFRAVGRRLGKQVQAVAKAVAAADAARADRRLPGRHGRRRGRRRPGPAGGGRPDRHRDPARGLDRRQRRRADRRTGPDAHPGAGAGRAGPRGGPAGPGGPQDQRPGGQRPHRAVVDRRRRRGRQALERARRADRRRGARGVRARRDAGRRAGHRGPRGLALLGGPRRRLTSRASASGQRRVAFRARARSARFRSGSQTAHGVNPSVRASSTGSGIGRPAGEVDAARPGGSAGARRGRAPRP